jgi:hypothetical protein
MTSDLDLLELKIETLWQRDNRGRMVYDLGANRFAPHLVIAASNQGQVLAFGSEVPDVLVAELRAEISATLPSSDPAAAPTSLARCEQLLRKSGEPVELSCSLSYVIPPGTSFPATTEIQTSDQHLDELLLNQDVARLNWPADEWRQLIAGEIGPWAMAVVDRRVISICHSARLTDRAAEAGVWTDPAYRGRGHAAAVTAAWAALLASSGRHLFYSHSATNLSSQRVTGRLKLRPIGRTWRLSRPRET